MADAEKAPVEKADEISQDVEKLAKKIEEFGLLKDAQKATDAKIDKIFDAIKALQVPIVKQEKEEDKKEENELKEEEKKAEKSVEISIERYERLD